MADIEKTLATVETTLTLVTEFADSFGAVARKFAAMFDGPTIAPFVEELARYEASLSRVKAQKAEYDALRAAEKAQE